MAVKRRDNKCSPYIAQRYKVLGEIMLDDVIVSILRGVGLIVQLLMGRKQLCELNWGPLPRGMDELDYTHV